MGSNRGAGALGAVVSTASQLYAGQLNQQAQDRRTVLKALVERALKSSATKSIYTVNKKTGQMGLAGQVPANAQVIQSGESTASNPAQAASQLATLQGKIQQIDQRNKIAPLVAQAQQYKRYPDPQYGIGGYTNTKPNWFQGMLGQQQRPPLPDVPTSDTSFLKQQLGQLTGQAAPTAATGVSSNEVNDLTMGIQKGLIKNRQQAVQVIQQAGLDPNDPAFAQVLQQLQ